MGDLKPSVRHLVVIENDYFFDCAWFANSCRESPYIYLKQLPCDNKTSSSILVALSWKILYKNWYRNLQATCKKTLRVCELVGIILKYCKRRDIVE